MKKIFYSAIILTMLMDNLAFAQYEYYPSYFGRQTVNGGTARYMAIGGAATALGADLGAAHVNPAGLGMYRKSEMSFSPNFGFSNADSKFINQQQHDSKGSFGISNIGVALCNNKEVLDESNWRGGTFSLGMTRTNSFQNKVSYTGVDQNNSMADYFVQQANGNSADDYDYYNDPNDPSGNGITDLGGLAYYAFLIEPYGANVSNYYHGIQDETVQKEVTYTTKGNQTQWNIAYGANYKDKVYVGAGVGITGINFREELNYTETVGFDVGGKFEPTPSTSNDTVDYFTFNDYNSIKGTGINLKQGCIFKPTESIRIGYTITSPTIHKMTQQYSSDLTVEYKPSYSYYGYTLGTQSQSTTPGSYKYTYTTPMKAALGLAIFAGKNGFISADAELVPYTFSEFGNLGVVKAIADSYRNVINLRAGGEVRIDIVKLRAGFAYLPNPYSSSDNVNRDIKQFSGGIGVRLDDTYFDLGIVNSRYESLHNAYTLKNEKVAAATTKNSILNVAFTIGFYFE